VLSAEPRARPRRKRARLLGGANEANGANDGTDGNGSAVAAVEGGAVVSSEVADAPGDAAGDVPECAAGPAAGDLLQAAASEEAAAPAATGRTIGGATSPKKKKLGSIEARRKPAAESVAAPSSYSVMPRPSEEAWGETCSVIAENTRMLLEGARDAMVRQKWSPVKTEEVVVSGEGTAARGGSSRHVKVLFPSYNIGALLWSIIQTHSRSSFIALLVLAMSYR